MTKKKFFELLDGLADKHNLRLRIEDYTSDRNSQLTVAISLWYHADIVGKWDPKTHVVDLYGPAQTFGPDKEKTKKFNLRCDTELAKYNHWLDDWKTETGYSL